MDETIGVRGGHNDRRRMIIRKQQKEKIEKLREKEEIKKLENKVKKGQIINFIQFLPIAIVGQTIKNFSGSSKTNKESSDSKSNKDSFSDLSSSNIRRNINIIFSKKGQFKDISKLPNKEKIDAKNDIESIDLLSNNHIHDKKKIDINKKSIERIIPNTVSLPNSSFEKTANGIETTLHPDSFEKLKGRKIIDIYEKQLKDIRYDLRKTIFEYDVLVQEKDKVVLSKDVENLMDRLSEVIEKIEILKSKMDIEDLDKYDDDYVYSLIDGYLSEFKDGEVVSSLKDSPLYVLISEKISELEKKKDFFKKGLDEKRDELKLKEDSFEELKNKYYHIDKINEELLKFQKDQEFLLKEIQDKVNHAVTVQEKVEVEVKALDFGLRRMLQIIALSMFVPGKKAAKGLAASVASYLMFAKQLLHPETVSRKYKVIKVEDYTADIEMNIKSIEDSISMLYRTEKQIDKIIYEIEVDFSDYIDVLPECKNMLSNLRKIRNEVREKEYEMEKIRKEQELQLKENNEKVLTRGVYKQD